MMLTMTTDAAKHALEFMWARVKGRGGLVLISSQGEVGHYASTQRMAWASAVGLKGQAASTTESGLDNYTVFSQFK